MRTLLLLSVFGIATACDQPAREMAGDAATYMTESADMPMDKRAATPVAAAEPVTKQLIKTGGIDFESEDVEKDYEAIRGLLPRFDAYIENENQSRSAQRITYHLMVRVPSSHYDSLFMVISELAYRLEHKYSSTDDATDRYYDLQARIKNKKALESRYLELLNQATNVRDIIEIERNLNEVRTETERLQGQFDYLQKQVNMSTLQLSFYEVLPYVYDSSPGKRFGNRVLKALSTGWQGFLSFLIGLTSLWPFLLLAGAGVYVFKRVRRRRKTR